MRSHANCGHLNIYICPLFLHTLFNLSQQLWLKMEVLNIFFHSTNSKHSLSV